jgi:hypothetical protein
LLHDDSRKSNTVLDQKSFDENQKVDFRSQLNIKLKTTHTDALTNNYSNDILNHLNPADQNNATSYLRNDGYKPHLPQVSKNITNEGTKINLHSGGMGSRFGRLAQFGVISSNTKASSIASPGFGDALTSDTFGQSSSNQYSKSGFGRHRL